MTSAVLEARAVIRAEDRTKAAFDSIEARINKLVGRIAAIDKVMGRVDQIAGPMNRATAEVRKFEIAAESMKLIDQQAAAVRKSFTETAQSIEKATAAAAKFGKTRVNPALAPNDDGHAPGRRGGDHHHSRFETLREVGSGVAPLIGLGIAYEGAELVRTAVRGGFERQHERVRMATAGMNPGEIAEAEGLSASMAAKYPAVGQTEMLHLLRNARSVVGSYHEASKVLEPLLDLRVVAEGAHPGRDMKEDFDQLIKGLEIKGVTQDPAAFRSYINSMGKAVNAFGDTLRPTDFYEMFKYGRQSTTGFSEDYMMTVAPTLAQEMKGSSAGVANSAFFRAIVGGRMEKGALARLKDLGLVDESKLITPKGGHIASAAGAIRGSQLAQVNPYQWVNEILLPAMHKKGIVDPQKVQEVINSVFSNQVAAQMVGIYASQQGRIEKDRAVIAGTMDTTTAARRIMDQDPTIAAQSLKNAFENLAAVFADKGTNLAGTMAAAAEAVNGFSARLQHAYEAQERGDTAPSEAQKKFNGLANEALSWWNGWESGGSNGGYADGMRRSQIATGRARSVQAADHEAKAEDREYDVYENSRNAGQLKHDAVEHDPKGFWDSLLHDDNAGVFMRDNADSLRWQAEQARADVQRERERAERGRKAGALADELDRIGGDLDNYEGSSWRRATHMPAAPISIPSGPAWFPMGRSYGDIPLPGELGPHGAPAAPAAPVETHATTAEEVKAAISSGTFMAQLDPNSKASIDATFKVEPSSELLRIVEGAKTIVASGSMTAGNVGTSGSLGASYPHTAPAGRHIGRGDR